jgi:chemotaxis protein CheD
MRHTVEVGDMKFAKQREDEIITYSLGSCIGLTLFDPEKRVGGLVHCLLPLSKADPKKAAKNPYMYTDTGVLGLIKKLYALGADRKKLVAKLAGGAAPLNGANVFNIGERNLKVVRAVLEKNRIGLQGEDVGGTKPRTMTIYLNSGLTTVKFKGIETEL